MSESIKPNLGTTFINHTASIYPSFHSFRPRLTSSKRPATMDSKPPEPNFDYEATLTDRKYFFNINDTTFIKRTLRRSEWVYNISGNLIVPSTTMRYRLENEAACLKILATTNIPIANLQGIFQDDGAMYLMTRYHKSPDGQVCHDGRSCPGEQPC